MKEKKQSKDWHIAVIHWLIGGFAMPFLLVFILGGLASLLLNEFNTGIFFVIPIETIFKIIIPPIDTLGLWLGAMYSAKYLSKTYIIRNSDNIVKLSVIYLALFGGGFSLIEIIKGITLTSIISLGFFVIDVAVFYMISKKYMKNNDDAIVPQQ